MAESALVPKREQTLARTSPEQSKPVLSAVMDAATEIQQVCFMLAGGEYGVDISLVKEIIKPTVEPTPVPQSPFFVEGVLDLRGDIIPIIDLKKRFGLKVANDKPPSRILVISMADIIVGFLVVAMLLPMLTLSSIIAT